MQHYLKPHETLLADPVWSVQQRLWLFQLDSEGFLVSNNKYPPEFLKALYDKGVGYVSIKGFGGYFYLMAKSYINTHPNIKYTSQLRPDIL